jgi:hypothetical protein
MLLCDAAQEVGGKLYIIGGGWSQRRVEPGPALMAVAIKIYVGWNEANEKLPFVLRLMTADGQAYNPGDAEVRVEGMAEVGRPAGIAPGSELDAALAVTLGFPLAEGSYRFEFEVRGEILAMESFAVRT